jgi:hypothetical protein
MVYLTKIKKNQKGPYEKITIKKISKQKWYSKFIVDITNKYVKSKLKK